MASNTDPANLIIDTEHDCQASSTNATRYRLDPANDTSNATRCDTLADPVTL